MANLAASNKLSLQERLHVEKSFNLFSGPQVQNCQDPGQVSNARRTGNNFQVGARVTYECEECYRGGGSITCLSNAQWSARPTCNSTYCCLRAIYLWCSIITIVIKTHHSRNMFFVTSYLNNDVVPANFLTLNEKKIRKGLQFMFSRSTGVTCPTPPTIANAIRSGFQTTCNSEITYTCEPGYSLQVKKPVYFLNISCSYSPVSIIVQTDLNNINFKHHVCVKFRAQKQLLAYRLDHGPLFQVAHKTVRFFHIICFHKNTASRSVFVFVTASVFNISWYWWYSA